jgi:predicted transcriptional regulator
MPKINSIKLKKPTDKFKKVSYRPWDLEGNQTAIRDTPLDALDDKNNQSTVLQTEDFEKTIRYLHGIQKEIIIYLCKNIDNVDNNYAYTKAISSNEMASNLDESKTSLSSSLYRLKKKNLVQSYENKTGRGGFASFMLDKSFYEFVKTTQL